MSVSDLEHQMSNLTCHNLSSHHLTAAEKQVLGLGLNMVLTPKPNGASHVHTAWTDLTRLIRLKYQYQDQNRSQSRWRIPNPEYQPAHASETIEFALARTESLLHRSLSSVRVPQVHTLSRVHLQAIHDLAHNENLVIKPADKNLGLTVLDKNKYQSECLKHLTDSNVYLRSEVDVPKIMTELEQIIRKAHPGIISKELKKYFFQEPRDGFRPALFYIIMKVHKTPAVGRPIAASHSWCTHHVSEWLDTELRGIVAKQPTYLKDSSSLVLLLEDLSIPQTSLLASYDVVSLYPSIPISTALRFIHEMLIDAQYPRTHIIMPLLEWVMRNSYVEFDNLTYQQIRGTAMGTPVAPAFATLFMSALDREMAAHNGSSCILLHRRYLDDGAVIWTGTKEALQSWLDFFNSLVPEIKLTWEISSTHLDFLDLHLYKGERFKSTGILDMETFQKRMNMYLYVPFCSYHPLHTKKSFVTAELKRYLLRSSSLTAFQQMQKMFFHRLRARGYPTGFLLPLFQSVHFDMRAGLLQKLKAKSNAGSGPNQQPGSLDHSLQQPSTPSLQPLVFRILHEPVAAALRPRHILQGLATELHLLAPEIYPPNIITAWILPKKLKHLLVRAKFRKSA
jgi:hypothetical protein